MTRLSHRTVPLAVVLLVCSFAVLSANCSSSDESTHADEAALGTGTRYEAESATTNLPTETRWPGFSGSSYLCCWLGNGQYATFHVTASKAGTYPLHFGYSAGSGAAVRVLTLNGKVATAKQSFPRTSDWNTWTTLTVNAALVAGANTVELSYDSTSSQYINLDYLDVDAPTTTPPDAGTTPKPDAGTTIHSDAGTQRIEAENSNSNLPTETIWGGFSGASYLCCWSSDGQAVTFNLQAAEAGNFDLTFGYSAGSGGSSRRLTVNGSVVTGDLAFPATSNWNTWGRLTTSAHLNAGANSVTLGYDSASGSHNWINLDYLDVGVAGVPGSGYDAGTPGGGGGLNRYADNDGSIVYSRAQLGPAWTGSPHSATQFSSSFSASFRGTDFQWIGKKGPDYGIATIYLDGAAVKTVDNYSSSNQDQQVLYSVSGLSNAVHVFRAAIGDWPSPAKNSASSGTRQTNEGFATHGTALTLQEIGAGTSQVTRTGPWTCAEPASNANSDLSGVHCWNNSPGSTMSVTFVGTGIEIYQRPDGENGKTDVYLDGKFQFTFDGYGAPYDNICDDCTNATNTANVMNLSHGTHTLKLVVSAALNPNARPFNGTVDFTQIDEFRILP